MCNKYYKTFCVVSYIMGTSVCETAASLKNSSSTSGNLALQAQSVVWSDQYIQNSLKTKGPLAVCAEFRMITEIELKKMEEHVENIKIFFKDIRSELDSTRDDIKNQLIILSKDIELMVSYYKDCFDELKHQELQKESIYISCIENLKGIQTAIQNLRNSINNILSAARLLASKSKDTSIYKDLKGAKREMKVIDGHCNAMTAMIDGIISRLIPLLRVYHEHSYEERNKGLFTTQSKRFI